MVVVLHSALLCKQGNKVNQPKNLLNGGVRLGPPKTAPRQINFIVHCFSTPLRLPLISVQPMPNALKFHGNPKRTNPTSSGSPSKRKYKDIEGSIHTISEKKIPSSGNRYFDFNIQEKEEVSRVVCFSPDKHKKLKDQQDLKTPVRLFTVSPQKSRFQTDVEKYKLYNFSQVQEAKNLSLRWKDVRGQVAKDPSLQQTLQHSRVGDIVSVKVLVLLKGQTTTVTLRSTGKEVKKCELIVSDGTAVIAATIWDDVIETVTQGQAYVFGDVRVGYFNKTYLQCAQSSTISPCNEEIKISEAMALEAEKLKPKETESKEIEGRILAVGISKLYVCVNCNGRIKAEEDNDPEMVKCTSCKQMTLVSLLSANFFTW